MSYTNGVHTGKSNTLYMSYAEATRATIKSSVTSPQKCVGGTQNPEVPGRASRMVLLRATGFSHLMVATVYVRQSDRL